MKQIYVQMQKIKTFEIKFNLYYVQDEKWIDEPEVLECQGIVHIQL